MSLDMDCVREIERLKRSIRVQRAVSGVACSVALGLAVGNTVHPAAVSASNTDKDGVLHVHGLVVEDDSGHERVRLGAPLPGPLLHNVRQKRNGTLSGLLLTDATGTERSGYATEQDGEAFLTLDSQHGQEMTLLSNAGGGVNFDISDPHGNQAAMTVFPSGPRLKMKRGGTLMLDLPGAEKPPSP